MAHNSVLLRRFGARREVTQQSSASFDIRTSSQVGAMGFQSNMFIESEGARSRPTLCWNQT
jgi:hypothetical protein